MATPTTRARATGPVDHVGRARLVLALSIGVTVALYLIPGGGRVAYPLVLISTLVHELGHGIAAVIAGGHFDLFKMHADGSGVTHWHGNVGSFARGFISAGGLVGPALIAAVAFVVARRARLARICLAVAAGALVLAAAIFVRGSFGLTFTLVLAGLCGVIAWRASEQVAHFTVVFLAVQLALSVYSRSDYLFTRSAGPGLPSDVEQMSRALGGPYWLWGWICGGFSALVLLAGAWLFLRGARRAAGGGAARTPGLATRPART